MSSLITERNLLEAYSRRLREWAKYAEALALMNRSIFLRDVYAYAATNEAKKSDELFTAIIRGEDEQIEFRYEWLYRLGRLLVFQGTSACERDFALYCLEKSTFELRLRSHRIDSLRMQVELLAEAGEFSKATEVLVQGTSIYGDIFGDISVDLKNPFVNSSASSLAAWLEDFNRRYESYDLAGIELSQVEGSPFDRVTAQQNFGPMPEGPLVTVIMTSYAPEPTAFKLAAKSILNQSWKNLELIIIDDASPEGPPNLLDSLAESDSRVRVIKLPQNRGTYYARNMGIQAARGHFITGQDSDDWSHPDRIYRQVRELQENRQLAGVAITAIRSDDNLFRVVRGVSPVRLCEVSLMFNADTARKMGGYLESRKGADSEFRLRLELITGRPVKHLEAPLYLTRLSTGSLSRSDFRRGWSHPNRRAFTNFLKHWHRKSNRQQLAQAELQALNSAIPVKFRSSRPEPRNFDFVYVADWRFDNTTIKASLEEIEALKKSGCRVGILQLAGMFPEKAHISKLHPAIQEEINSQQLDLVIPDEGASIKTLVIREAGLMQFAPDDGFVGSVERAVIVANRAPSLWDGREPLYSPESCVLKARKLFGTDPIWLTQDPAIQRFLAVLGQKAAVRSQLIPFVLPTLTYRAITRKSVNARNPVIVGRHVDNLESSWSQEDSLLECLWSQYSAAEVRLLGNAQCYRRKYEKGRIPSHWTAFKYGDISQEAYYSSLDYFVYYPDERLPQELSYESFIAYANGCTAVLPMEFASMHESYAVISEQKDAIEVIEELWWDRIEGTKVNSTLDEYRMAKLKSEEAFVRALTDLPEEVNLGYVIG